MVRHANHFVSCLLAVSLVALCSTARAAGPWTTLVVGEQSEAERLATVDLQRYLAQAGGAVPVVIDVAAWQAQPKPAVILGTPRTNSLLRSLDIEDAVGEQGYWLSQRPLEGVDVVIAAGATWRGAVNATYGLLRELGYGFYLGSEAIPESLPSGLSVEPIVRQPIWRVRGVLPWYNFFNSPTAWDPVDHRAFADQLIRMGANFVGFHTYDTEPFAAYEQDGNMQWGARLLNTGAPTWGTAVLPISRFGFGTDRLFEGEYFGAALSLAAMDADEVIRREQDIMRAAMDYAHRRGLLTCLGFEISGDPLNPKDRDVFLRRVNHVLDQYPLLDYIWIWQPETQGAQGFADQYNQHILASKLSQDSLLPAYGLGRREAFRRVVDRETGATPFFQNNAAGRTARATEGARLEQFAQLACHALAHRKNPPKLVICGWGGDERLLSAEYYEGLDKLMPRDVGFASLDHIVPRPRVDSAYHSLPPERERWPIPWLEFDGDQWHPQPYVHAYEQMAADAQKGNSQGLLGIHWRTRDLDENFAYLMQYAWQPGLTADQFFSDYARRCYSPRIAGEMAAIHNALDKLGYRWVGGGGQSECGGFTWGPGEQSKADVLRKLRDTAAGLLPKAGVNRSRLQWLLDEMDWVLLFREAEAAAVKARDLITAAKGQDAAAARQTAARALSVLDRGSLARALQAYARRVSTRGEYGVLATVNTKAVVAWRELRAECLKLAGQTSTQDMAENWDPTPAILLPRFVGSVPTGQELTLSPVVLGGGKAWAHYRALGSSQWQSRPLENAAGWVRKIVLPATALVQPGVRVGFSFSEGPASPMAFGPITISVMPAVPVETAPRPIATVGEQGSLKCSVAPGRAVPIELTWADIRAADFYKVYRDGRLVVETAVAYLPDSPPRTSGVYVVEAWRDGKCIARSDAIAYTLAERSEGRFDLKLESKPGYVLLRWPAATSPLTTSYRISRTPQPANGKTSEVVATRAASHTEAHVYSDIATPGKWLYAVTPIDVFHREAAPAEARVEFQPREINLAPVLDLPLTAKPTDASVIGEITFTESGAAFKDGYISLPHRDEMDLGTAVTLAFEFKADAVGEMPVLLSHGQWQVDGWFVQILGGSLIVRTTAGDISGPRIEPGQWYRVRFVFDGDLLQLAVNGQWLEPVAVSGRPTPAKRDLIIGQYDRQEPTFAFKGCLRNVKLYPGVVMR